MCFLFLSPPYAHARSFPRMAVALLPVPFLFIMKPYAEKFYKSKAWQNTRNAYWSYRHGLCEICLSKGRYKPCEIVHHKIQITPENINDPTITLNWDNLQCVCRDCHAMIHEKRKKRFKVDDLGRVIIRD